MRMTKEERRAFDAAGYLLRRDVCAPPELEALRGVVERVAHRVRERAERDDGGPEIRLADGHRLQFSSRTVIQWEWQEGSRALRLLEPVDHLDPALAALFEDPRLAEPMRDVVGCEALSPFTSKLNLKRRREGSEFPWHQDFPYWYVRIEDAAHDVGTAILFLDDADPSNGALRVLPGSHLLGPAARSGADPTRSLADPAQLDVEREVIVEASAGSVLFFGSLLVHRSSPNTSESDRRALLMSFQPAGRPHWRDTPFHPERVERLP